MFPREKFTEISVVTESSSRRMATMAGTDGAGPYLESRRILFIQFVYFSELFSQVMITLTPFFL